MTERLHIDIERYVDDLIQARMLDKIIPYNRVCEFRDFTQRSLYVREIDENIVNYVAYHVRQFNIDDAHDNIPNEQRAPIKIFINSYGGSMYDAMHIIDIMQVSNTPIYTIGEGYCLSAGGLILIAGHKRMVHNNTIFLLHDGSMGMEGDTGKLFDNFKFHERYMEEKVKKFILDSTKISPELFAQYERKDWFMTAQEMIDLGVADELLTTIM